MSEKEACVCLIINEWKRSLCLSVILERVKNKLVSFEVEAWCQSVEFGSASIVKEVEENAHL